MHYALRAVIAEPDRILAERGLTRVHHRILFFVGRSPGMSIGELQSTLDVSKQALAAPLKTLAEQALLMIDKDAADARVRRLRLSSAGEALERRLTGAQYARFESAFRAAGEDAVAGWQAVMRELATRLESPSAAAEDVQRRIGRR